MTGAADSGIELARRYHDQVVAPILATHRPGLRYAAARVGAGSEVLGYDDDRSRDHDWGLRLSVMVGDHATGDDVRRLLEAELPAVFEGRPTRFALTSDPTTAHRVGVGRAVEFATSRLGMAPHELVADPRAWLRLTGQAVLEVTAGAVFRDDTGELTAIRQGLRWYPDDVWHYVVASAWQRLAQELPFVGRTADVGDDLGSRIITGRLARVVMHLAFLVERTWCPYPKWAGTAFQRLACASTLSPALTRALRADAGDDREQALVEAIEAVHDAQQAAGLPGSSTPVVPFFDRPYRTVDPLLIAVIAERVADPAIRALRIGIGSVEQWVDNVDALLSPPS